MSNNDSKPYSDKQRQKKLEELNIALKLWPRAKSEESNAVDQSLEQSNKIESDFRNLQFVLATFLFTFTTPMFTKGIDLTTEAIDLILLSWMFLFASILAGMIHMTLARNFFLNRAKFHFKKMKLFSRIGSVSEYQETVKKANQMNKEDIPESPKDPLVIQSGFLLTGFVLILRAASVTLLG